MQHKMKVPEFVDVLDAESGKKRLWDNQGKLSLSCNIVSMDNLDKLQLRVKSGARMSP